MDIQLGNGVFMESGVAAVRGVVMAMAVTRQKENETDDAPWGFRAGRADALQAVGADDSNVGERRLQCVG